MHAIVIEIPGKPPVQIGWTGEKWEPIGEDSPFARAYCEAADAKMEEEITGSHHLAPGVAQAIAAAQLLGGRVIEAPLPGEIPEGAIS